MPFPALEQMTLSAMRAPGRLNLRYAYQADVGELPIPDCLPDMPDAWPRVTQRKGAAKYERNATGVVSSRRTPIL